MDKRCGFNVSQTQVPLPVRFSAIFFTGFAIAVVVIDDVIVGYIPFNVSWYEQIGSLDITDELLYQSNGIVDPPVLYKRKLFCLRYLESPSIQWQLNT
jgi:hypothetical protein